MLRLYQFGTTTIPAYAYRLQADIGARTRTLQTIGGYYDVGGTGQAAIALPYQLTFNALVYAAGGVSALGATLDDLRALIGTRARLWGDPMDSTAVDRWAWARLLNINYSHEYQHRKTQPYQLTFEMLSAWNGSGHGGAWDLDAGYYFDNGLYLDDTGATTLDSSPKTITVANNGNYRVDNCGITVTCGATAAITALTIGISGLCEFTYSGTLATGKSLVIDCGAMTVTNDGADGYAALALTSNHTIPAWLRLAPGNNSVVVTLTGGSTNSEVTFTYSDGWA